MSWQVAARLKYDPLSRRFAYQSGGSPSCCLQPGVLRIKHKSPVPTEQVGGQAAPGRVNAPLLCPQPMDTFSVACGKVPGLGIKRQGSSFWLHHRLAGEPWASCTPPLGLCSQLSQIRPMVPLFFMGLLQRS